VRSARLLLGDWLRGYLRRQLAPPVLPGVCSRLPNGRRRVGIVRSDRPKWARGDTTFRACHTREYGRVDVRWPLPMPPLRVTVLLAGDAQSLAQCMTSVRFLTDDPHYQVRPAAGRWPFLTPEDGVRVPVDTYPPSTGLGVADASDDAEPESDPERESDMICALAAGVEPIEASWLRELVTHNWGVQEWGWSGLAWSAQREPSVQGPLVLGSDGTLLAPLDGVARLAGEPFGRPWLVQAVAALVPGCLLIHRSVLEEVGGLDPQLDDLWRAIDLALRVREKGYRAV